MKTEFAPKTKSTPKSRSAKQPKARLPAEAASTPALRTSVHSEPALRAPALQERSEDRYAKREKRARRAWYFTALRAVIREEMKMQGLSLTSFAQRLGKDKSAVSRALNPENDVRISTLVDMAEGLGKRWDAPELLDVPVTLTLEASTRESSNYYVPCGINGRPPLPLPGWEVPIDWRDARGRAPTCGGSTISSDPTQPPTPDFLKI